MLPYCMKFVDKKAIKRTEILALFSKRNYASEAKFDTKPYKLHKLDSPPPKSATLTKDQAIDYFTKMATIRRMETVTGNLYKEKAIRGFCHLYSGQEAVACGMIAAMRPHDCVITSYRAHGWTYLMGSTVLGVLAELTGRSTGCQRGKGGSMHMYVKNFFGGNGIVGAQVPLGAGIALASMYKGNDGVCFALYGDGASNQGQCFEAYNIAYLLKIPAIFVCENNGYGMGTSAARSSGSTDYYKRGDYMPGLWIDGMDILTVREGVKYAIEYCKAGKGPLMLEMVTYRYSGHSMSDPGTSYRSRDEVNEVRQSRDPISQLRAKITSKGLASEDDLKKIEADIKTSIDKDMKRAKTDKEIGMDELVADVYSSNLEPSIRNILPWEPLKHKSINKGINAV